MQLETEITEMDERIKELMANTEKMEEEYEKLYYEHVGEVEQGQKQNNQIAELIMDTQHQEKTIEKLNLLIQKQQNDLEDERG